MYTHIKRDQRIALGALLYARHSQASAARELRVDELRLAPLHSPEVVAYSMSKGIFDIFAIAILEEVRTCFAD